MASPSFTSPSLSKGASGSMAQPVRQHNKDGREGDSDLAQSLQRLTITTSSPAGTPRPSRVAAPSPLKPVADTSPRTPRPSSAMRSPLRSASASAGPSSRSATPTLLRKASMNSLHSSNGVAPSRRSSSANVLSPRNPRSARSPLRSVSPELPEKPKPTPQSVASAYFKAELDIHHGPEPTRRADTVVVLQDSCYGHRYSRPRTSRATLDTIVERPERIKACVLGVAAAYVRLGERHQDGSFPVSPETDIASLPTIPFRIQNSSRRLSLGSQTVTNVHGTKWMEELRIMCDTAETKLAANGKELQRPDIDRGPNAEAPRKLHEGDLYLCAESLDALEGALGGVCDAVDAVFSPQGPQRAFVAIRPPGHHCSASHPSGFCWINNVHVGIMHAVLSHGLTHAAIIDFDLHHGDGSQSIAWQHNARGLGLAKNAAWWKKTSIGYFSLHDINSYPCEVGDDDKVRNASICIDNAHGQSIWNVHLQPWKTEADFWTLYEAKYAVLLEKTRAYLKSHTERLRASGLNSRAAIFLSAGFDASEWEDPGMQRHNVNVPTDFYARFTRDVVRVAAEEGTSVEGRIISVLEGGYSDRALCSGVFSHLCGLAGDERSSNRDQELTGSVHQADQMNGPLRARKDSSASERGARQYEPSWWSPAELGQLEAMLTVPPTAPKPPRNFTPPTYSSPTQSSQAKAVMPKARRSVSGLLPVTTNGRRASSYSPPPPPAPDVPWTVAAHELSKLLIPSGRQTSSCTPEDLNAEATRIRRERQAALGQSVPAVGVPAPEDRAPTRTGLRERKAKPPAVVENDDDRKARRKTVAGPSVLAAESVARGATPLPGKQPRSSGRRLSASSTIVAGEGLELVPSAPRAAPIRGNSKTDTSARPESSESVGGPNGSSSLAVKKTRAPAKKESVPRAPRAAPKKPAGATNGAAQAAPSAALPAGTSSAETAGDDVDKLAGEVRKIKITVLTKAQKEARERERAAREKKLAEAETVPQPAPSHSPTAPTLSLLPIVPTVTSPGQLPSPALSPAQQQQQPPPPIQSPAAAEPPPYLPSSTPSLELTTAPTASPAAGPLASPPVTDPRPRLPPPPPSQATSSPPPPPWSSSSPIDPPTSVFIPYQPEGPTPVSSPQQQQQPLQWLPPNVHVSCAAAATTPGRPSPAKRGDHLLPVFTSTSVIPFAAAVAGSKAEAEAEAGERAGERGGKS